jgi:hypothetical protein
VKASAEHCAGIFGHAIRAGTVLIDDRKIIVQQTNRLKQLEPEPRLDPLPLPAFSGSARGRWPLPLQRGRGANSPDALGMRNVTRDVKGARRSSGGRGMPNAAIHEAFAAVPTRPVQLAQTAEIAQLVDELI